MEELLEQLRWMLNLPVGSSADEIKAHLEKLIGVIKQDATATAAASVDLGAMIVTQRAAIASLSTAAPDPTKYVPIDTMRALQTQVAALSAQITHGTVDELVTAALTAGKLLPAQEAWARQLGAKDTAALSAYIDSTPVIAALGAMQTTATPPVAISAPSALTANQVALCTALGVPQEQFLATLQAEAA